MCNLQTVKSKQLDAYSTDSADTKLCSNVLLAFKHNNSSQLQASITVESVICF